MKKQNFEILAMDYLSGRLSKEDKEGFELFLSENEAYRNQWEAVQATWNDLDALTTPEPSTKMDERFFDMLHVETSKKETAKQPKFWSRPFDITRPQLAFGMMLLLIGLGLGYFLNDRTANVGQKMVSNDTEAVRQKLVLTLLEQPSANQRLEGVSEANKFNGVDEQVVNALLLTLNHDDNVNVRLAAIESLANYADHAMVRQGLVQSIPNQESPIVQVTLANLMLALQEKKSVEPFKKLLKEKKLDTLVKKKIEHTIESII
ncbi:hypothetical protein [Allomuricauda sp. SCSIO 65647]|uniref:hypothetical protein n=1 Tax=Allomuricauda sp. SCSIO 65647 TaxID=2908843 RepID=UPI001F39ED27|nr:hypothetical protein [Muricauda sp. SCSIO 65647]UJH68432.1 hypothetical protein L0P89_04295 [Muricauda sp. SCSIO 65647]